MALLTRIYFNAVFGALGGLLGWLLFGAFGAGLVSDVWRALLGGALIGGAIGYLVVSVEAIRDRSVLRLFRLASYGLAVGAAGGALGMLLGDEVNTRLINLLGYNRSGGLTRVLHLLGTLFARALGWMFLGLAIGAGEGIAARSLGKFSYGMIGGTLGGLLGGALFGLVYDPGADASAKLSGSLGLIILGACIGSLSALVQGVFQPASVKVLRGWQEGREYPLEKADVQVGRDEHADIALFRDMRVEKRHVAIRRDGPRYILKNNGAPPEFTRVNDEPVAGERELHDGDRIQLGNVLLRFQMRAAVLRKGARPIQPQPLLSPRYSGERGRG